jgi:hypothetical protein
MRKFFIKLYIGGLISLPIVLMILPADYFDKGQSLCLSVLLFHQKCYACGITRGIQHLIHFDFQTAWQFNKLCVVITPLLIVLLVEELVKNFKKLRKPVKPDTESSIPQSIS